MLCSNTTHDQHLKVSTAPPSGCLEASTPPSKMGKVILKGNGDEALSDESLLKSNSDEAINNDSL
jgi:hypothetical protein